MTRDDFEFWIFVMSDRLEEFSSYLPPAISSTLDYSPSSLSVLERWLLDKYTCTNEILKESEKSILDMSARYFGQTIRKRLSGKWNIDLTNPSNAYYRLPVIEKDGSLIACPVTLVTACLDRRTGDFIEGVSESLNDKCCT